MIYVYSKYPLCTTGPVYNHNCRNFVAFHLYIFCSNLGLLANSDGVKSDKLINSSEICCM